MNKLLFSIFLFVTLGTLATQKSSFLPIEKDNKDALGEYFIFSKDFSSEEDDKVHACFNAQVGFEFFPL